MTSTNRGDRPSVPLGPFTWRRVTQDDFPLLGAWLAQPHVHRWWHHETTPAAIERDFGAAARGEEPSEDLLVSHDGQPLGLVQRSRYGDYPEYLRELAPLLAVSPEALSLDYFVGDPARTGRGLGTAMMAAVLAQSWIDHPDAPAAVVPVAAGNRRSWRLLERVGFDRVAQGDLPPDNPADPPLHFVYRAQRPRGTGNPPHAAISP